MDTNEVFRLGVGQAHEFEIAARREGWTNSDLSRLIQSPVMIADVLALLRGQVRLEEHIIDCDAAPLPPEGFWIETADQPEKAVTGKLVWRETKIELLATDHMVGRPIGDLYSAVGDRRILGACLIDFLLKYPQLIPESWKHVGVIHFLGTVCRRDAERCVRNLNWDQERGLWETLCFPLHTLVYNGDKVAVI